MQVSLHRRNEPITVSFLMALGLHAAVLLGVGFLLDFKPLTHPLETLDIVLVNWRSETAPDEADFLAQAPQQGGGESTEVSRPSQENAGDRKSTRLNSSHTDISRMPSSA